MTKRRHLNQGMRFLSGSSPCVLLPNSTLDNGRGNCYYVESAGFVSIPDTWNTDHSGVVLVSTGVMQLVKLSACDALNGKLKIKR